MPEVQKVTRARSSLLQPALAQLRKRPRTSFILLLLITADTLLNLGVIANLSQSLELILANHGAWLLLAFTGIYQP